MSGLKSTEQRDSLTCTLKTLRLLASNARKTGHERQAHYFKGAAQVLRDAHRHGIVPDVELYSEASNLPSSSGSALVWLFIGGLVAIILIAGLVWGKLFVTTEGIDTPQVDNYKQAIDNANSVKQKAEDPNRLQQQLDIYNK